MTFKREMSQPYLTWAFLEPSVMEAPPPPPNHNFVVIAPMIIKSGTGVKLDLHDGNKKL